MCGISGILHFDTHRNVDETALREMTDSMVHRGPDDEGFYLNGNVGFGFRRLSIIDLHTGHQPMSNEDDTVWIAFNGEVYNFPELRERMIQRGHVFQTGTDTETIVHLYEEYGNDCVKHLRGMFGFAIWDERRKKLFCARDHFGIKPFFYHHANDRFVFGSEIKTVLAAGGISNEIDVLALDQYFAYKYVADDRSIYSEVKKLKPAHWLEIQLEPGGRHVFKTEKYWNIEFKPDFSRSETDWAEEVENMLSESVKMQMVSDVPLGAFLSGGIDSSAVVALMSQHSSRPVKTFSIGFKEKQFNELPYAREVAQMYGTEHHEQIVEPDSISLLPMLVRGYDEPFADPSAIPTWHVSKFAREHVTVALSGDGGDELFAGYNTYPKLNNLHRYNRLPNAFNRLIWGNIHPLIPNRLPGKGISYYLSMDREMVGAHMALWMLPERKKLYQPELWNRLGDNIAEQYKERLIRESGATDYLSKMQELDMRTFMVDDVLTKVDRASMLNSLEVRVPILDHKLAELSFRIPANLKLKGMDKKYILKKAIGKHLPPSVISHRKQGFSVPLNHWFKDALRDYLNDRLSSKNSLLSQYLQMDYVAKVVEDHHKGLRDLDAKIWSLVFMDAWLVENGKLEIRNSSKLEVA
ncbi:MAG: asparagine synthase (glutamine-hydrolyzing) [Saprospiraceae bacterium]|nr:asparagine synthase (glutamine-hydrolyzing) [Saprospiraceae bacterium]MCF8250833.1 asparagine synthase (glutamine-hydrolyzing) [Saprospiraceae bacterium]MCF8281650.1 asparagine synthase (glutamine-hydrolyzing) [Bacteroidales bacterium]MCF8312634.1 asparagine synthase (glutamine-hydrolyzing) [Saprospiraceae bacterium]MCF8441024.1 asparagine synthase (glutamine-hydrolyzing) [Saprospiraceae bacterium]